MDHLRICRKKTNLLFGLLCLLLPIQMVIGTLQELISLAFPGVSEYTATFFLPQLFYPLMTAGGMLLFLFCTKSGIRDTVRFAPCPAGDTLLYIPAFLGLSTLASYLAAGIISLLEGAGVSVPDMTQYFPDPSTPMEMAGYFLVIAILPPICEELLFRAGVAGTLRRSNRTMAILFSAMAFSLTHATIQQIPGAFLLGLLLADAYLRYDSLILPMTLHFVNNAYACIITFLTVTHPGPALETAANILDVVWILLGLITGGILVRKHRRTGPQPRGFLTTGQAMSAGFTAVAFWCFAAIFLFLTVLSLIIL